MVTSGDIAGREVLACGPRRRSVSVQVTLAALVATALAGCAGLDDDDEDGGVAAQAGGSQAVCVDGTGRRVEDAVCRGGTGPAGGGSAGGGSRWYYYRDGDPVPAVGARATGGSYTAPDGGGAVRGGAAHEGGVARGGFGGGAHGGTVGG